MSVEARMLAELEASQDAALVRAMKTYGYAPQDDEKEPTRLPLLVLQRAQAEWLTDICGTANAGCFVSVILVHIARGAEEARTQAQAARLVLLTGAEQPQLETETEEYDPDLRGWLVTQSFRVWDDAPEVATP
jgi:hypothetical protein